MEVDGHRAVSAEWQPPARKSCFPGGIAVLAVAAILGAASPSEAATSIFWPDYYQPAPPPRLAPLRVHKSTRHRALPSDDIAKDARKPQGPLIIAISIDRQVLKIYDANGYFAETPISTGMRGHSTPMGVFSVIQKHKYHRSNIYSGAPMPYMQRITWSGVAMHAGVLPGYPASHGCIRMPMNFAVKMWGWTRMGARVVITPGELQPENFSHPLLAAQKVAPAPAAAAEPKNDVAVTAKSDRATPAQFAFSEASLELKSTVGHDLANPAAGESAVAATLREQTHTADASSALSRPTISDATSSAPHPTAKADGDAAKASDIPAEETKAEATEPSSKSVEAAASDDNANIKSAEATAAEVKPAEVDVSEKADVKSASAAVQSPAQPADGPVKNQLPAGESVKADNGASEAAKVETAEVPDIIPEVKKDQTRAPDPDKAAAPKPEPAAAPKRTGQIAVFVSRKDGKLYVRQNFAPLFDVPVTIAPSDRPLGTHVFTAQTDKDDANLLHWSAVSMPAVARYAARQDDDERASRRRKTTGAIEVKPAPVPDSAAEALDRLTIPADAMARIAEALSTGGSIIVSDQGITAGETGEGTDFIVPLR
jgi:L,D-transpeptidase catalytic domain